MPHFHFHLIEGSQTLPDGDGSALADDAAAIARATVEIRSLLASELRETGEFRLDRLPEVVADDDRLVTRLPFEDAVTIIR